MFEKIDSCVYQSGPVACTVVGCLQDASSWFHETLGSRVLKDGLNAYNDAYGT